MPSLAAERIESLKAGIVGGSSLAIAEVTVILFRIVLLAQIQTFGLESFIEIFIATVSGFLFGVTYRYITRNDRNTHLQEGAVLAFGLVRGLALVEGQLNTVGVGLGMFSILQSLIGFAIARWILDIAIAGKLIKPFI